MQRREEEEARHRMLIDELEASSGVKLSEKFKSRYISGADELTLVRSGLDDTMRGAYAQMRELWHEKRATIPDFDLRTARLHDLHRASGRQLQVAGPVS
ncbi:MAG: hypothetical protein R3D29_10245 [Nitratireductor sp.]